MELFIYFEFLSSFYVEKVKESLVYDIGCLAGHIILFCCIDLSQLERPTLKILSAIKLIMCQKKKVGHNCLNFKSHNFHLIS